MVSSQILDPSELEASWCRSSGSSRSHACVRLARHAAGRWPCVRTVGSSTGPVRRQPQALGSGWLPPEPPLGGLIVFMTQDNPEIQTCLRAVSPKLKYWPLILKKTKLMQALNSPFGRWTSRIPSFSFLCTLGVQVALHSDCLFILLSSMPMTWGPQTEVSLGSDAALCFSSVSPLGAPSTLYPGVQHLGTPWGPTPANRVGITGCEARATHFKAAQ